ncbi:glycoside hydrolase family 2 TIM barrel-domain containing protein [Konateibacter massiliensis]|uniref:glycoside hydrolase family 2 TIM barrel-domain containing protein n=1 Tax=Konateibacter massiliensis TaxID=2002841 RepID=UPI000C146CF4|nr:glycoside hydrolase family 2 TIM barrel-domain containing protein [Konateibacter massiliensis]
MNLKQPFNTDWSFTKQPIGATFHDLDSSDTKWQPVDVPHDWLIYGEDLYENSEGWYKKSLSCTLSANTLFSLCFDGVYMNCTLFLNRQEVGSWQYGYTSFEFDITAYLKEGENEILLRVKHEAPNSRWYTGAGIYRKVWLRSYAPTHFISNGIYISTQKEGTDYFVTVSHEVAGDDKAEVRHTLLDKEGNIVLTNIVSDKKTRIPDAKLWCLDSPYLYTMQSDLIIDNVVVESETNRFGIRTLTFDADKGFFLNDVPMKLNGVCQHHDLGALGGAFHKAAAKRQLILLQKMGANAVRISHNMPDPEYLNLADEMGILIINEAFDMWERSKTSYDYARFFKNESAKDVRSWIRRDRNHPCIIMWSIGNEIYDTHVDAHGADLTSYLIEEVQKHDYRKNAAITIASNYMPWENAQKCADIIKLAGYNYAEKLYQKHHKEHPDWVIYGSETSSLVQSRGIYHFPLKQSILSDDDCQCSALGNSATSWGAKSMEFCILSERDTPFSLGQFIWTGFDYIGEPTPYHTRNSYFGQLDTAGFPKDAFYFYQSAWTDCETNPMVHIAPYWDFSENQLIDVRVMSNASAVELFLNDVSQGIQELEWKNGTKLIGDWQLPYTKGELRAVAYNDRGEMVATDIARSFGDASSILIEPDKRELTADGEDLIFLTIQMLDSDGAPVENANNRVHVEVKGAARLVGLDNGDSTDYDSYKGSSRRLFSGKLLAILASTLDAGEITVHVASPSLPPSCLTLAAVKSEAKPVVSALLSSFQSPDNEEIPVRKIEIIPEAGQLFTKETKTLRVSAKTYPSNATYEDLSWQITNDAGVPIKIASLEPLSEDNRLIQITAYGDGDFRLRASCKNGKDHAQLISSLEFHVTGLGSLTQNPYEFISGSLYSSFEGEVSSGNERGVATARDGKTVVTYDNLDFGDYGSDTVTIPIFELESAATQISFYEGRSAEQEGTLLGTFTYHKQSKWNVYQEETFRFSKRLKGITSLSIALEHKIHIKGFSFKKEEKAFATLFAAEADRIYGDAFTISAPCVEGIGNNVSLEFHNMDFGAKGFSKLTIYGRSPIDKNTIHIRFHSDIGDSSEIAEFTHSVDYEEQSFSLSSVYGMQDITFVFLPGSNFDFKSFYFE